MGEILGNPWWGYVLLGLAAGILSGTLGVGSGAIMVPALVLIMALPQKSAQGTSLAIMVPMVLTGALRYKLDADVSVSTMAVVLLVAGAIPGALLGSELAQRVPASVLRKLFAAFLIIIGAKMAWPSGGLVAAFQQKLGAGDDTDTSAEATHKQEEEDGR